MSGTQRRSVGNVRLDMDIPYPKQLTKLNSHLMLEFEKCRARRSHRCRNRYRTQPITYGEIREVDEEKLGEIKNPPAPVTGANPPKTLAADFFKLSILGSQEEKLKASDGGNMDVDKKATEKKVEDEKADDEKAVKKSVPFEAGTNNARKGSL